MTERHILYRSRGFVKSELGQQAGKCWKMQEKIIRIGV